MNDSSEVIRSNEQKKELPPYTTEKGELIEDCEKLIDPTKTALIVMDMTDAYFDPQKWAGEEVTANNLRQNADGIVDFVNET
jgi:hypothetical protein